MLLGQIPLLKLVRLVVSGTASSRAPVHIRQLLVRDRVKQLTLSTHRPGPDGPRAEGSGLEDFSPSPSICAPSMWIS